MWSLTSSFELARSGRTVVKMFEFRDESMNRIDDAIMDYDTNDNCMWRGDNINRRCRVAHQRVSCL